MDMAQSSSAATLRPMLFRMTQAELDELYDTLPPLPISTLNGTFRGRIMGLAGITKLPRPLRAVLYQLLQSPLNPWRGKYFANGEGANVWLRGDRPWHFARYVVETDAHTGLEFLNYNIDKNWKPLRGIRGEARQLTTEIVLARMHYQTTQRSFRVLYFTLEKTRQ